MKKILVSIAIAAIAMASAAQAQTVRLASGSPKGTYSTQVKEMVSVCGDKLPIVEVNTGGSMENIDKIVGNEVTAGYTQSDALWLRARTEELGNIKTLLAMHPEQVHVLVKAGTRTSGGIMGFGAKDATFRDWSNLAGKTVAASGGSAVTARIIRLQSEIPFNVVEYPSNDAALAAMSKDMADAAVLVGGAPLPSVKALNAAFRLLPASEATISKLKGVYKPARLTYSNLNAAGINTVSTDALLVTRTYSSQKMQIALGAFRSCVLRNVDEIKDTAGTHPSWQKVDPANHGVWPWYDLPAQ